MRFTPENRFDSPIHGRNSLTQEVGPRGSRISRFVIVAVVSAAVTVIRQSAVWLTDANNQYNRIAESNFGEIK